MKNKGITLIALVITIIVLLILAGITINLTLGEHGILNMAKQAGQNYQNAAEYEQGAIGDFFNEAQNIIAGGNGNSNSNPTFTAVANAPDIKGFNKENTYYVTWNLNETKTEYVPNENKMSENIVPSNWYDYTEGINNWANIKTTGGGNDCYWVWIPRYAYCITEGYHSDIAGTIDIKFLKGTTNIPIDGKSITINNSSGAGNWNVHPAFWWDKDNDGIEEEGEQLTGIWVAKFEASSSKVSEETVNSDLNTNGGGNVSNLQVRVKPNVTSWREINVGNIFTVCQNLTKTVNEKENSLVGTTNLDSHMMKNTEWGAVAYLSRSIYGKNGEVWSNPYNNNSTNNSPITGLVGNSQNASQTNLSNTYKYNEITGGNASTTGNVYGIYDMVGGAWEYVAGYLDEVLKSNSTIRANSQSLYNAENKYKDKYIGKTSGNANYKTNSGKYGDAIYETSNDGESTVGSWNKNNATFPSSSKPIFVRGDCASSAVHNVSVFSFSFSTGEAFNYNGFRPVVVSP